MPVPPAGPCTLAWRIARQVGHRRPRIILRIVTDAHQVLDPLHGVRPFHTACRLTNANIARDLSEKIEKAIIQPCGSLTKGNGHCDLCRFGQDWEVKNLRGLGLDHNQSKVINGEKYIVVNYKANSIVKSIWVLRAAEDRFFSPRLKNPNVRTVNRETAISNIETLFDRTRVQSSRSRRCTLTSKDKGAKGWTRYEPAQRSCRRGGGANGCGRALDGHETDTHRRILDQGGLP